MKTQLLTAFDIHFLAVELSSLLTGKAVKSIVFRSGDYYFTVDDIKFKFSVFRGSPYLTHCDKITSGQNRLNIIYGGVIQKVNQIRSDRLLGFEIVSFDRLGKRKTYCLYLEIYKNGNIVMTDSQNKIMFSHRKSYSSGDIYKPGSKSGFSLLDHDLSKEITRENIEQIIELKTFQHSAVFEKLSGYDTNKFIDNCLRKPQYGLLHDKAGEPAGFVSYGPPYREGLVFEPSDSLLDTITLYIDSLAEDKKPHIVDYQKMIKKAEKKLAAIAAELAETENYKRYRMNGELILANMHTIKKGQTRVELENHDAGDDSEKIVTIALEQSLPPDKNAAAYFDKARKLETAIPIISKRYEKQKAEIERLKKLDSGEIEDDFQARKTARAGKQYQSKIPFKQYDFGNGWRAYAGKSAKSNDQLTFGFANKDDLWFHAWQTHGSHVILRAPQKGMAADHNLLLKAASLAAYLSKAKSSSKVPVIYTEVRYLRKVKKVPGKAIYANEKELMVEPVSPGDILGK